MNHLLFFLNEADVAATAAAAKYLKSCGVTRVWALYSPATTVSIEDATKTLDAEIDALKAAKAAAIARDDLVGADGHKKNIEAKQLDRIRAIGDAWKRVEKSIRNRKIGEMGEGLVELEAVKVNQMGEHRDAVDLPNMLNAYLKSSERPTEFVDGEFGISCARVYTKLPARKVQTPVQSIMESAKEFVKATKEKSTFDPVRDFTLAELEALKWNDLKTVASHRGVFDRNMTKPAMIQAINAKVDVGAY